MRVAVAGALGRMGSVTCGALDAAEDIELVGGFDRQHTGEPLQQLLGLRRPAGRVYDNIASLYENAKPDVVVDFTVHPVTLDVARVAVERGISPVIGATGWTNDERLAFTRLCEERKIGAALVPNFAIGAVLMMRFAAEAAKYFPTAEIVELHHDRKLDKPSGTAKLTAERMGGNVPIHSVRLRGLVAHQEVLLGGEGETLTIRHDSLSRESFMSGVLLAVRGVRANRGLVLGLDPFLTQQRQQSTEAVSCA